MSDKSLDAYKGKAATEDGIEMLSGYMEQERHELPGGRFTDAEIAYKLGILMRSDLDHESVLTMGKDRIRWLSAQLHKAEQIIAAMTQTDGDEEWIEANWIPGPTEHTKHKRFIEVGAIRTYLASKAARTMPVLDEVMEAVQEEMKNLSEFGRCYLSDAIQNVRITLTNLSADRDCVMVPEGYVQIPIYTIRELIKSCQVYISEPNCPDNFKEIINELELRIRHIAPEAEEWGEWIEHDGQSIPHIKRKIEIQHRNRNIGLREGSGRIGWLWSKKTHYLSELDIIRYRIKKP